MPPYIFLPLRSNEPTTQAYLDSKFRSYEICIANECFDDAYINAHLIFIYWLYCKLWVTVLFDSKLADHIFALHSFDSRFNREAFLLAQSALQLHNLKLEERKYAEVFGAMCLSRDDVRRFKNLVDDRNKILHPSGAIIFSSELELERSLRIQIELADKISEFIANMYIKIANDTYGKLSYRKVLKWEADYNLEQTLFTKYQLAEIDFNAIKRALRTK